VALTLGDGSEIMASLLIAADGSDSGLRRAMGIASAQWNYGQTAIVCVMGHERPHRGVAHERFLPAGPFAVLPMTDDPVHGHRSSIVWTEKAKLVPAMLALPDADFSHELHRRFGPWLGEVRVVGGRWSYPLRFAHAETYIKPRFALVGDAAHTMHPIAGQGLNIGLRDVAALAEVVVEAKRLGLDLGSPAVLERYQRWRRFDNQVLLSVTDSMNWLFSNDLGPVRLVRDLGMAAVNRMGPLKRLFMRHAMGVVGELPRLLRGEAL
jgi:2-octaprenyl-6-methoxyphenol hydroxylase